MQKIKLLIDARVFGGEAQGSLTYIRELYIALMDEYSIQYDIYFAGYDKGAIQQHFGTKRKYHFIQLSSKSRLVLWTREFPQIIKKHQINFAHFQYVTPFIKNCQHIVTTHDVLFNDFPKEFSWFYRTSRNFLFGRSLRQSEVRLTVSNYSRQAIGKSYALDLQTVKVTPNAVPLKYFEPYEKWQAQNVIKQKYDTENYILYVSRIEPRKNHQDLLRAYREMNLADKGIALVFIGNGTLENKALNQQIAQLTDKEKSLFKWIKYVDDEDLLNFYRAAKLFVYPSKAEGFGIPPIEAAALKIPTVCSNTTSMSDFSFFNENLIDSSNIEILKEALFINLTTPPSEAELQQISDTIRQKYAWTASAAILHQEIQRYLIQKGKRKDLSVK